LGTVDDEGAPFVSMVPFAAQPVPGHLVIHVSGLAAHTRNLQARPDVSLLVSEFEARDGPVHALPRVTLKGVATVPQPDSPEWRTCRDAYLRRFPEAEPMTSLDDFRFVSIRVTHGRQVAGFGTARDVHEDEIARVVSDQAVPA